ncbi:hypothetical protein [Pedobacter sp. UBA4863]|uniref:DUF6934 family protein n=1 Tax=Pedobacter sp. UBA4863 TaxID=1947060 RepID=UPI0025D79934|nr:hypothetical protein [Pedobacter sp. UBA4863]
MKDKKHYDTELTQEDKKIKFMFASTGNSTIIKLIEYAPIQQQEDGRYVYNLGFGDYDDANKTLVDDVNSNNGDMYTVFNTVLHSIPVFFAERPYDVIYVRGSDSADDFKLNCINTCTKKCKDECRKTNQRINTYRYYVNKNFDELSKDYDFYGRNSTGGEEFVQYVPGETYHEILVYKKK